jgi:hypothetical protein
VNIFSWVIGTAILWGLKALVTNPLARLLYRSMQPEPEYIPPPVESAAPLPEGVIAPQETGKKTQEIPAGYYILVDVAVMSIAGFLLGLITGYYFIGISLRTRDWPGMLAFIAASFIGSFL